MPPLTNSVGWSASEFINHQKSTSWYAILAVVGIGASVLIFLVTHDVVSAVLVAIVALTLGYLGSRQPRVLDYKVDTTGIYVGPRFYPYALFKSFSIVDEGPISSIMLLPLKRFMPFITIYFSPDDEDKIADLLGQYLPFEHREHDAIDKLMRKIRF